MLKHIPLDFTLCEIQRKMHSLKPRCLQVCAIEEVGNNMRRITLCGADMAEFPFELQAPDAHVKLYFPKLDGIITMPSVSSDNAIYRSNNDAINLSSARQYTIRAVDRIKNTLTIDMYLHAGGVASSWVKTVQIGNSIGVMGPRGSKIMPLCYENYVLIADETGLPALARWLEILPETARVAIYTETMPTNQKLALPIRANSVYQDCIYQGGMRGERIVSQLSLLDWINDAWIWGAGEADMIKQLRQYFLKLEDIDIKRINLAAYWKDGEADFKPN